MNSGSGGNIRDSVSQQDSITLGGASTYVFLWDGSSPPCGLEEWISH